MTLAAWLLCIVLLVARSATAFDEPDGFRGVPWGTSEWDIKSKILDSADGRRHGFSCIAVDEARRWAGDRQCRTAFLLGSIPVEAYYTFRADRFVGVSLVFPSDGYARAEQIFIERYGPATSTTDAPYRTTGGATFTNRHQVWNGTRVHIELSRFGSKATESIGGLTMQEERTEAAKLYNALKKDAAKGL